MNRILTLLVILTAAPLALADSKPFIVAPRVAPVPKTAAPTDPSASCCKVVVPSGTSISLGSGTVVACEGGKSLVLTNRHVVSEPYETPEAPIARRAIIEITGKKYPAQVVAVDRWADLAMIRVDAALPAVPIAESPPAGGETCQLFGHTHAGPMRHRLGQFRPFGGVFAGRANEYKTAVTETTILVDQGDSGSGVLCDGKLAAVLSTKKSPPEVPGPGSCVHLADVRRFTRDVCKGLKTHPKLAAELSKKTIRPPVMQGVSAPACPGGTCPGGVGCPNGPCPTQPIPGAGCPNGTCPLPQQMPTRPFAPRRIMLGGS